MTLKIRNSVCYHKGIDTGQVDSKRFSHTMVCYNRSSSFHQRAEESFQHGKEKTTFQPSQPMSNKFKQYQKQLKPTLEIFNVDCHLLTLGQVEGRDHPSASHSCSFLM